jgi:ATP-dependent RNA helicase DeaD
MTMTTFAELGLSKAVLKAVEAMGYEESSPMQAQAVLLLMKGRDVIVQSLTGTGKTVAFGIRIVEQVEPDNELPQALVLTATRERTVQVAGEISRLGRFRDVSVVPLYGGQSIERQLRALRRGAQVVVATPGRLLDHIRRRSVNLADVKLVVLNEADDLFGMGLLETVELVLEELPSERQTILLSTTMPDTIVELADAYLKDPERLPAAPPEEVATPTVEQHYYEVPRRRKMEALARLIDIKRPDLALVFCATRRSADDVAEELLSRGYRAEALHGQMSQATRDKTTKAAREGRLETLVVTDFIAGDLGLGAISHVVNYDLPQDAESYTHRVGQVGRDGHAGQALTLVAPWEVRDVKAIERATGARIERSELPVASEVEERDREQLAERLLSSLRDGRWGPYCELISELAEEYEPSDLAAAALALASVPARQQREEVVRTDSRQPHPQERRQGFAPSRGGGQGRREGGGGQRGQRPRGDRPWFADRPPRRDGGGPGGQNRPHRGPGGRRRPPPLGPPGPR